MATITVTVPDAVVARIQAAFAQGGSPATVAIIQDWIKANLKLKVQQFEAQQAASQVTLAVNREEW